MKGRKSSMALTLKKHKLLFLKSVIRTLCVGVCAFSVCVVLSSSVQAETLSDAVTKAAQTHPSAEAAYAALQASEEFKKEEYSAHFPTVSMTTAVGRLYGDNATSRGLSVTRGSGYSNLGEASITARQPIFTGFEVTNRNHSAAMRKEALEMNVIDVQERLALRAVQAYLDVLRAREALATVNAYKQKVDDYLVRIENAVSQGAADESEFQQARDVQTALEQFVADYEGQVEIAEADYTEVVGSRPDAALNLPDIAQDDLPSDAKAAVDMALANHPALKSAEYMSRSSAYDVAVERSRIYPKVNGEISYLKSDKEDIIGGEVTDARAVVRANWDIETGGAQLARIRKRNYEYKETKARIKETRRQIELNVRRSYSEMDTAMRQLENQNRRLDLNEKLHETYEVQFEGARASLLQLMQTDNEVLTARLDVLNGAFRTLFTRYATLASMGMLRQEIESPVAENDIPKNNVLMQEQDISGASLNLTQEQG